MRSRVARWGPALDDEVDGAVANDAAPWHLTALGLTSMPAPAHASSVLVAILDSGVQAVAGLNGKNVEHVEATGKPVDAIDLNGHGTRCASLIASGRSEAPGVLPSVSLLSVRVAGADGAPVVSKVEAALKMLVGREPDVISCSFILPEAGTTLLERVRTLTNLGAIVVGAAGNSNSTVSPFPERAPDVFVTAAVDEYDAPLPSARMGRWIDAAAPGKNLCVVDVDGAIFRGFGESSGAAAIVSGVLARVLAEAPPGDARRALARALPGLAKATCRDVGDGGPDDKTGAGVIQPALLRARALSFLGVT